MSKNKPTIFLTLILFALFIILATYFVNIFLPDLLNKSKLKGQYIKVNIEKELSVNKKDKNALRKPDILKKEDFLSNSKELKSSTDTLSASIIVSIDPSEADLESIHRLSNLNKNIAFSFSISDYIKPLFYQAIEDKRECYLKISSGLDNMVSFKDIIEGFYGVAGIHIASEIPPKNLEEIINFCDSKGLKLILQELPKQKNENYDSLKNKALKLSYYTIEDINIDNSEITDKFLEHLKTTKNDNVLNSNLLIIQPKSLENMINFMEILEQKFTQKGVVISQLTR